jgi:hypothetical protein
MLVPEMRILPPVWFTALLQLSCCSSVAALLQLCCSSVAALRILPPVWCVRVCLVVCVGRVSCGVCAFFFGGVCAFVCFLAAF